MIQVMLACLICSRYFIVSHSILVCTCDCRANCCIPISTPHNADIAVKGTRDKQKKSQDAMYEPITTKRISHSVVARMLGRPDTEAQLAQARAQVPLQQSPAHDEVSEQLSPLENLALDADTKVWQSHFLISSAL